MIKRRNLLRGATATGAVAAAASFPAPAISQGIKQLRMVTTWPKRYPGQGTSAELIAERITQMTEGKLEVKVFAAGELVPAFQSFDAVSLGSADMAHSAAYYWQGKSKAFSFFCTVPFGFTGEELAAWVYQGGGQQLWDEAAAEFGIKSFLSGQGGPQMGGWYRREINAIEDFKGLKIRIPAFGGEMLRRLGAAVTNLPPGEIFGALQSGAVDAAEWVGPWNDLAFGFHKVAKHYYFPGVWEPGGATELMINKGVWEGLTKEQQRLIEVILQAEYSRLWSEFVHNNLQSLTTLKEKHGVQVKPFSDDILQEFGRVSGEILAEMAETDEMTRKVYDSYARYWKQVTAWTGTSTQAFLAARSMPFKYL